MLSRNKSNNKINITWYRKSPVSDRFLNCESQHPQAIKNDIIKNMITKILQKQLRIMTINHKIWNNLKLY